MRKFINALKTAFLSALSVLVIVLASENALSQTVEIPTGSFIINMGVTPQTVGNGLKPYGLVYDLVKDYGVSVHWSIEPAKSKDGIDFSHNGIDYRGGTFIVPAEFRTPTVNARIAFWQGQGVVGATSVSPFTVPLFATYDLRTVPRWTMDQKNGSIATGYFVNAGIPPSAHGGASSSGWKLPSQLDCCDDLFVMPHADPIWSTHSNLYTWNLDCKGAIWAACHATSALENMVNPADRNIQTNFLTVKDPNWNGTSGNYALSNSLILWGSHAGGTPPYSYRLDADPVAQFMGIVDAATQNGSEQIVMPRQGIVANASTYSPSAVARWNPDAKVIVYDPSQANVTNPDLTNFTNVASVMVYGRGYDDPARGYVMYQPAHSHNKSTAPANIASQRAFFNYSFLVANEKAITPDITGVPGVINSGTPTEISHQILNGPPGSGPYTSNWASTCGGSFSPNPSIASGSDFPFTSTTTFNAPTVTTPTPCNINITVTDACGRQTNISKSVIIQSCNLTLSNTITNVACNGEANGSIDMVITGSPGPFTWSWSRVSPTGTGSGSGTTISGLSAGTYNVTVTDGGACNESFTATIAQPNPLNATPNVTNYLCFGQTGAINLTVTGGTSPYTYSWTGPEGFIASSKDLSNILFGTYNVTVTDNNGCITTATATVTGPASAVSVALDSKTNVICNGANNGIINITASGGTPGYTYLWSDGSTDEDRSGLVAGTYTVTVSDVNACTAILTETISQPSALTISVVSAGPTCPPGANPPVNSDGTITVTANGGTEAYNVSWTGTSSGDPAGDEILTSGGSYIISNLQAGPYTVTVTDVNGCTANVNVTINAQNPLPVAPANINNN